MDDEKQTGQDKADSRDDLRISLQTLEAVRQRARLFRFLLYTSGCLAVGVVLSGICSLVTLIIVTINLFM